VTIQPRMLSRSAGMPAGINLAKAILVTYPEDQAIKEAISLADAAHYLVAKIVTQKHITKSKYGIGAGKAQEVKEMVETVKPEVIIFDEVLKPTQMYNLASLCKVGVIDRERLILDIFEKRASTAESRTQIKLAQLRYEMARAREKVRLAKRGEQPGFFGLGKYQADVYFLDIKRRASILKKKLESEETRRRLHRSHRTKEGLPTISLAGYTSAGKTTLFNTLVNESKATGQGVFTTLSTSTRSVNFNGKKALLLDTVGFISKLPAYMIDAFKSTLDELAYANLVLLVLDASESVEEISRKLASSLQVINEFEVPETRIIYLLNKVDLISAEDALEKAATAGIVISKRVLPISAKTGFNIESLKRFVGAMVFENLRPHAVQSEPDAHRCTYTEQQQAGQESV
jgi:GTP-binding protein HflX